MLFAGFTATFAFLKLVYDYTNKDDFNDARAMGVGGIRVSTHFFNTEREIEALLGEMRKILK